MIGAVVGDIVGSVYEWHNIKSKDFPMFRSDCRFTDDTVMTFAVAEAIMNGGASGDFITAMKRLGRLYSHVGYGGRFSAWLDSGDGQPYNSYGNGSAMRVSPCAWAVRCDKRKSLSELLLNVETLSGRSALVTHNHPEGIKGAMAAADAIFICRYFSYEGAPGCIDGAKTYLRQYIEEKFGYDLSITLDDIRPTYVFDVSCQGSVPQAIIAFLESTDFEDAIRNAVSIGGDSDTIAAITGSIAEAAYGVPQDIVVTAETYLDANLRAALAEWQKFVATR